MNKPKWALTSLVGVLLVLAIPLAIILANGTETLGTPSIEIADGSGVPLLQCP